MCAHASSLRPFWEAAVPLQHCGSMAFDDGQHRAAMSPRPEIYM